MMVVVSDKVILQIVLHMTKCVTSVTKKTCVKQKQNSVFTLSGEKTQTNYMTLSDKNVLSAWHCDV